MCALGEFPFGDELDMDMSLTPDVESTLSVAKSYEYPGAFLSPHLFQRRVWSILNVHLFVGSTNSADCRAWQSVIMVMDFLAVDGKSVINTKNAL